MSEQRTALQAIKCTIADILFLRAGKVAARSSAAGFQVELSNIYLKMIYGTKRLRRGKSVFRKNPDKVSNVLVISFSYPYYLLNTLRSL